VCNTLAIRYIYSIGTPAIETLPGDVRVTRVKHLTCNEERYSCSPPPWVRFSCAFNTSDTKYHSSVSNSYKKFKFEYARPQTSCCDASSDQPRPAFVPFILRKLGQPRVWRMGGVLPSRPAPIYVGRSPGHPDSLLASLDDQDSWAVGPHRGRRLTL